MAAPSALQATFALRLTLGYINYCAFGAPGGFVALASGYIVTTPSPLYALRHACRGYLITAPLGALRRFHIADRFAAEFGHQVGERFEVE
jgi:hypothetical protein